jgi:hypothetical protein
MHFSPPVYSPLSALYTVRYSADISLVCRVLTTAQHKDEEADVNFLRGIFFSAINNTKHKAGIILKFSKSYKYKFQRHKEETTHFRLQIFNYLWNLESDIMMVAV